jgi:hypothetical protein
VFNGERLEFGLNSHDDCWVESLFLLCSFETGLGVSRYTCEIEQAVLRISGTLFTPLVATSRTLR